MISDLKDMIGLVGSPGALASFGMVLLVFGFAPGFVLRLVLLLYPPDDPRRAELLGELYAMKRWRRPMWVAQQIETAIWEGPQARRRVSKHSYIGRRPRQRWRFVDVAVLAGSVVAFPMLLLILVAMSPLGMLGGVSAITLGVVCVGAGVAIAVGAVRAMRRSRERLMEAADQEDESAE